MKTISKLIVAISSLAFFYACGADENKSEVKRGFSKKKYDVVCSISIFAPIKKTVEAVSKKVKTEEKATDLLYETNLSALRKCLQAVNIPCTDRLNVTKSSSCYLRKKGKGIKKLDVPIY